jgi:hypothetical protein
MKCTSEGLLDPAEPFVSAAARAIEVASSLVTVGIAVLRADVVLSDFGAHLIQHFAANLLILPDFLDLVSSTIRHGGLPWMRELLQGSCHGGP